ncbi:MAG: DinB family protein [Actinomycetota bacterium]|nr:DinB family protein [Actinomycetota bacterium]MDQ2956913.1 DinB family protein [Actinomycetota bacterium]
MTVTDILTDAFGRIRELVTVTAADLSPQQLAFRPNEQANSIGWLIWHLTRVQDDHLADAAGTEQVWTSQGWYDRFELPFEPAATGYGQDREEVAAVTATTDLLTGYHEAVYRRTVEYLSGLAEADLGRVVDESWDPPVTLGARLVSVLSDDLQHVGQAAYLRGQLG